jgi:hypothetical protein
MFINYFKIAIRNLLNKKVYSGINLLGLSIAAAFCMLSVYVYAAGKIFSIAFIRTAIDCTGWKQQICLHSEMKNQRKNSFHF